MAALNRNLGALPGVAGNDAVFFEDYHESIAAMAAEVDTARAVRPRGVLHHRLGRRDRRRSSTALVRATERGVTVRLLFDHLGSRGIPVYKDMLKRLEQTEIEWHPMLPISRSRARGGVPTCATTARSWSSTAGSAFTGSQNLIEPGYNKPKNHKLGREWVELMARVDGPAVADARRGVRHRLVHRDRRDRSTTTVRSGRPSERRRRAASVTVQVVPSGPGFATENNLRLFTTLIYSAQRRISITSPYFVPDESLLYAVTTAAQRGVEVELFVSEEADQFMVGHAQASYYEALLEAGRAGSSSTPRRTSCTPSTSPSTTTSR